MRYRVEKPIIGKSLGDYITHCRGIGKPVDARFVGPSNELLSYMLRGFDVINFLGSKEIIKTPGHTEYGILFGYN